MVALHWITNPGRGWKVFAANRVKKTAETTGPIDITWKYCPSDLNLADLGSRGATIVKMERGKWFTGKRKMVYWSRLALREPVATAAKAEQHRRYR